MGKNYEYILFDLDGTLTDSGPGIMNAFAYAIEHMGGQAPGKEQLRHFAGPPLKVTFGQILGYSPEDTEKAIGFYREYYNEMGGVFENKVYPGIRELLAELKNAGKHLMVATSKGVHGTTTVLDHFDLRRYFDFVSAAENQDRAQKTERIRCALEACGIKDLSLAVMIGDRENDIDAANQIGIDSIGVLYGYGDREELVSAGATYLAETAEEVRNLLL